MAANVQLIHTPHNTSIFSHNGCFTNYIYNFNKFETPLAQVKRTPTPETPIDYQIDIPLRSCLAVKTYKKISLAKKKKVVFADDIGLQLTQVKVLKSNQDVSQILSGLLKLKLFNIPRSTVKSTTYINCIWSMEFHQPYLNPMYQKKLNDLNVSLDRIVLNNSENRASGTITVKNIAYEKEVFVRSTCNCWVTQEDSICTYMRSDRCSSDNDVFSFKISLPIHTNYFEFCIGFKCNGQHFWDNNSGKNFLLSKTHDSFSRSYNV